MPGFFGDYFGGLFGSGSGASGSRYWPVQKIQFRASLDCSRSSSGVAGPRVGAHGECGHTQVGIPFYVPDVVIELYTTDGQSGYEISFPSIGIGTGAVTIAETNLLDVVVTVFLSGIYVEPDSWTAIVSRVLVELNSSSILDNSTGWLVTSNRSAASGIPFVGVPWSIETGTSSYLIATGSIPTGSASGSITNVGGWRFDIGRGWESLPVNLDVQPFADSGASYGDETFASLSAGGTWGASSSASVAFASNEVIQKQTKVWLVPDTPKSIKRVYDEGYAAQWYRVAMPKASGATFDSWTVLNIMGDADSASASSSPEFSPARSAYLGLVRDATHAMEDVLAAAVYAPYECSVTSKRGGSYNGFPSDEDRTIFSTFNGCPSNPSGGVPWWYSSDELARYLDMVASPHVNYFLWFADWALDGETEISGVGMGILYWQRIGEQWAGENSLPIDDRTKRRNHIALEPLRGGGWALWNDTYTATLPWVGASRFEVKNTPIRSSYDYTSASATLWSADGCSIAHGGGGITISSITGPIVLKLDGFDFGVEPFAWPSLANDVYVDWPTEVSQIEVYAVGVDGSRTHVLKLATDTSSAKADWNVIRRGSASRYAGSWGIDNSGGLSDDTGTDVRPNGISLATMLDSERIARFGLLGGSTWVRLEFEVTMAGGATSAVVPYPKIRRDTARQIKFARESRQCGAFIQESGWGVRTGNWVWWDGSALRSTPAIDALTYTPTMLDWLATSRVLFEGKAATDGLDAEIADLLDAVEGQTRADADEWTTSMVVDLVDSDETVRALLVNSYREFAPTCVCPLPARDADFEGTGALVCESWSWAEEKRRMISPHTVTVTDPSGTVISAPETGWPLEWVVVVYMPAVDNDESVNWKVLRGSAHFASIKPWHGYFGILFPVGGGQGVANTQTPWGGYCRAHGSDSGIIVDVAHGERPPYNLMATASPDGQNPCLHVSHRGDMTLIYELSGDVLERVSQDNGATWSSATSVSSGMIPRNGGDEAGNEWRAWFAYNSGSSGPGRVKIQTRAPGEAAFGSIITIPIDLEDTGLDITAPAGRMGLWVLTATASGDTDPSDWVSKDRGVTWEAV